MVKRATPGISRLEEASADLDIKETFPEVSRLDGSLKERKLKYDRVS